MLKYSYFWFAEDAVRVTGMERKSANEWICRWLLDANVGLYECECRHRRFAQYGWQVKALTEGSCWICAHINADVSDTKQGSAKAAIALGPCSEAPGLLLSDADPRCWEIGRPLHLWELGEKEGSQQQQRLKRPTSCCLGEPRGLSQWAFGLLVCGRMTSHANSTVGCFSPSSFVFFGCFCGFSSVGCRDRGTQGWASSRNKGRGG